MPEDTGVVTEKAIQRELSLPDILDLASAVLRSNAERKALEALDRQFDKRVAEHITKDEEPFRRAVFAWLLGREDEARTAMSRRKQNPLAVHILGRLAEERGEVALALDHYKAAAKSMKDEPMAALAHSNAICRSGELDKAASDLDRIEKRFGKKAEPRVAGEIAFQRGRLAELAADPEQALDLYEGALSLDPEHAEAAFRMGCILDLRGDDKLAIGCYERCGPGNSSNVGAATNLASLYEDRGDYERAIACYRDVLRVEPDNRRARLFLNGAIDSTEEVYDELERKEQEKLDQVLRMPVVDFELSVRSRNVLARMNIRTLGDLVRRTESEMLAFRNFGETSLREIKQVLTTKGLKLGLKSNEVERRHKRERLALVMSDADSRMLAKPVSDLNLSIRARRCMARLNIRTVGDLVTRSAEDLMATKNFGHTSLNEIRTKLAEAGLSLRPDKEAEEDGAELEATTAAKTKD